LVRHGGLRERRQVASLPRSLTSAPRVTSRKLGNRRFLKPGCDQLFRAARNDNQACKRGARRAGEVYTVRYDAVNAMLLNEFLKEHRKVEKLEAMVAQQRKEFEAALTDLKGQIQKVSAQLELSKAVPQTVAENQ
jgi:hypothetical protein